MRKMFVSILVVLLLPLTGLVVSIARSIKPALPNVVGKWEGQAGFVNQPGGSIVKWDIKEQNSSGSLKGVDNGTAKLTGQIYPDRHLYLRYGDSNYGAQYNGVLSQDNLHIKGNWTSYTVGVSSKGTFFADRK